MNLYGKVFNKGIFFYRIVDSMGRFLRGLYCYRSWIFTRKWIFLRFWGNFLLVEIFYVDGKDFFYGRWIFMGLFTGGFLRGVYFLR